MYGSDNKAYSQHYSVRPVVSLKYDTNIILCSGENSPYNMHTIDY